MVHRFFRGGIRRMLILLVLISAFPGLLFILLTGLYDRSEAIAYAERDLLAFSSHLAETQVQATAATQHLLEGLAVLPQVRRGDRKACSELFAQLLKLSPRYGALHLVDRNGDLVASGSARGPANFSHTRHFREALASGRFSTGEYLVGVTLKVPVFTFGMPVLDDRGRVRFVLLTSYRLDRYGEVFRFTSFPRDSFVGIADRNGLRLYRSPEIASFPPGKPINGEAFARMRDGPPSGIFRQRLSDGMVRVSAYQQLRVAPEREPYMYIVVSAPVRAVQARARAGLLRNLATLVLSLSFALLLGWFFGGRRFGRRLETLAGAAARLGAGDLSARVPVRGGVAEVEGLSVAFNAMADALQTDNRERMRIEEELRVARDAARSADRAKTEFLANMSHEIRTPLNGILGMLHVLQLSLPDAEHKALVGHALRSGRRLTALLSDILDVSAAETGRLQLCIGPVEVRDLLDAVDSLLGPSAEQKSVSLVKQVWPGVPAVIPGDALRIRQVLFNLVGNGLKFASQGQVRLDLSPLPRGGDPCGALLIMVSDTGPGMAEEQYATAFELFRQISGGYRRTHQGAGLGLPIVRRLVGLMGGSICLESAPGLGCTVYVSIPLPRVGVGGAVPPAGCDVADGDSCRMLLLRGGGNGASAPGAPEGADGGPVSVRDAVSARERLGAERFDVVLVDAGDPLAGVLGVVAGIRNGASGEANRRVLILVVNARGAEAVAEACLAAGADARLDGPFDAERVRSMVCWRRARGR